MASVPLGERRMVKTKYGIKVPLAVDDYIWVTKDRGQLSQDGLTPVLYDTKEEAKQAAKIWGTLSKVEPFMVDNN